MNPPRGTRRSRAPHFPAGAMSAMMRACACLLVLLALPGARAVNKGPVLQECDYIPVTLAYEYNVYDVRFVQQARRLLRVPRGGFIRA